MIAVVLRPEVPHQLELCTLMAEGIRKHEPCRVGTEAASDADAVVCWGWRIGEMYRAQGLPALVMERGHAGDRRLYTSCGWNGLAGRGTYPGCLDTGQRWESRHSLRPWRQDGRYALVLGQVAGDAALRGLDVKAWAQRMTDGLRGLGHEVVYRPHPLAGGGFCPAGAEVAPGTLDDALAGACVAVTYSSTSGVEAVCAGVPVIAMDRGAMCWPVAGRALDEIVRPDRTAWAHALAWTQWTREELASGEAWDVTRGVDERVAAPV